MAIPTAEALSALMRDKRVTFRRYGLHGELKRPMIHRFPVKGGVSVLSVMAENVSKSNPLLRSMMLRGKPLTVFKWEDP